MDGVEPSVGAVGWRWTAPSERPTLGVSACGWSEKMNVLISSLCRRKLNPALRAVHPSPALYPGQRGRVAEAPRYTKRGARRNVNAFVNKEGTPTGNRSSVLSL